MSTPDKREQTAVGVGSPADPDYVVPAPTNGTATARSAADVVHAVEDFVDDVVDDADLN